MRSNREQRPRQTVSEMREQRRAHNARNEDIQRQAEREQANEALQRAEQLRVEGLASRPTTREGMIAAGLIKAS